MIARLGDRLIVAGTKVGDRQRVGVVVGLSHEDGTPPYTVRWEPDGREALIFPGPGMRIEPGSAAEKPCAGAAEAARSAVTKTAGAAKSAMTKVAEAAGPATAKKAAPKPAAPKPGPAKKNAGKPAK